MHMPIISSRIVFGGERLRERLGLGVGWVGGREGGISWIRFLIS